MRLLKKVLRRLPTITLGRPIDDQIEQYINWKHNQFPLGLCKSIETPILYSFKVKTGVEDVCQIDKAMVINWARDVYSHHSYLYYGQALKTIRCFLRYYRARKYDCLEPEELSDRDVK